MNFAYCGSPGSASERSLLACPLPAKSFPAPLPPRGARPSPRPCSDPPARPHFPSAARISNLRTKGGRGLRRPPSYPITRLEQPGRAGIPAPTCTTRPRGSGTAHRDLRPPQRGDAARPRRHLLCSPRGATSAGGGGGTPSLVATHSQLLALAEKVARMMSSKERRKYSGLILEGRRGMVPCGAVRCGAPRPARGPQSSRRRRWEPGRRRRALPGGCARGGRPARLSARPAHPGMERRAGGGPGAEAVPGAAPHRRYWGGSCRWGHPRGGTAAGTAPVPLPSLRCARGAAPPLLPRRFVMAFGVPHLGFSWG